MKEKWGILAGDTGWFKLDDVEVPAENLVGREDEGFKIAMFALDQGRYTVAAGATGLIRACRDASVKYALERRTFGVEIGQHQLIKEMIAQMESDYQAARLLWMRAGWLKCASAASAPISLGVKLSSRSPKIYSSGSFAGGASWRNAQASAMVRQWLPCRPSCPTTHCISSGLPFAISYRARRSSIDARSR